MSILGGLLGGAADEGVAGGDVAAGGDVMVGGDVVAGTGSTGRQPLAQFPAL